MTADLGSTVPRRQLGRLLRELRENARLTVKVAAQSLEVSPPTIWRIESGAVSMRSLDVEQMCRLYGASQETTEALMGLAKETKSKGWWHAYGDAIPTWFELFVGLESAASHLRQYEVELIPGLLQTEAYATAVSELGDPKPTAEIERRVAVRLERQALLTRKLPPAPQLDLVLNETALRRTIRDRQAMAEQLRHINKVAKLPNVSIRVLPLSVGLHRGALAGGGFVILNFPTNSDGKETEPPTVYSDGLTGALYLDKPQEVGAYEAVWTSIWSTSSGEAESRKLISTIAEEYASP
jgi:transcriptional regulator with XRE-family HTH domain